MEPSLKLVPPGAVTLTLRVTDPEVLAELARRPEADDRERFVLAALRIGVLALKQAGGALDERAIRSAGEEMFVRMEGALTQHRENVASGMAAELKRYFDSQTGAVPAAIQNLTRPNGQLDLLLSRHLGTDNSVLAQTLARHVGQESPLFRILSPQQKDGLLSQLADAVRKSLEDQRASLLREFDLNDDASALSRLIRQVKDGHGNLARSIDETVGKISREFSLDNEASSLVRFRKELGGVIDKLASEQREFQARVLADLEGLRSKRAVEATTTRKGGTFETALEQLLQADAQGHAQMCHAVGLEVGVLKNCKKGDFVLEFGADSAAPGEKIVVEAKDDADMSFAKARAEMTEARPNRQAQYGVFVWAKATAPAGQPRFQRQGDDVFVVWDPEDPASDVYVSAALEVTRALTVRRARQSAEETESLSELDANIAQIEKDAAALDEIRRQVGTITKAATSIDVEAEKLQKKIARRLDGMRGSVEALRPKS